MRHLFLIGNMGAGKSTVGARVAHQLGRPFFDLDTEIERATRKTIAQLFTEFGEPTFRQIESQILKQIANQVVPAVVACGGGTILHEVNPQQMRRNGWMVYLKASVATLLARITNPDTRPMLQPDPADRLHILASEREPLYQQADWVLETDSCTPEAVASQLVRLVQPTPEAPLDLTVLAGQPNAYLITIAPNIRNALTPLLASHGTPTRIALLTHPHLLPWAQPIASSLALQGIPVCVLTVPSGERIKNLRTAERLYRTLVRNCMDRNSWLMVVGGGVLGDVGGFVAATYMRGIPFVQIPTTLLAQVDSSVGGKVGVDLPEGKNLVGAFHHPLQVFIDPEMLSTLPARHWRNGFAEMLKYGIALHEGLWLRLQTMLAQGWLNRSYVRKNPDGWLLPIARCVQIKSAIVSADERDRRGIRALLNFGHTVGHAIERVLGYRRWLHGEAIAAGMLAEAQIGAILGVTPPEVVEALRETLHQAGLPTTLPSVDPDQIVEAMHTDKKRLGEPSNLVLLRSVGSAKLMSNIPISVIEEALKRCASS
mgnify:FL=1